MYEVQLTPLAESDIQSAVDWWKEHHSAIEAEAWYVGIIAAIQSLSQLPTRCRLVRPATFSVPVRQLLFGVSAQPTHRVLFAISNQTVTV
ncbi:MAG: type II toxin-antitoxin system RelE/ParE family toxin [Planctomycetales bacterium]|nr:type II toxin-antitoxin system RelE/ParE family toxin [Planctomycetales bacterium]